MSLEASRRAVRRVGDLAARLAAATGAPTALSAAAVEAEADFRVSAGTRPECAAGAGGAASFS